MKHTQKKTRWHQYIAPETDCQDIDMSVICASEGVLENFDSSDYEFIV